MGRSVNHEVRHRGAEATFQAAVWAWRGAFTPENHNFIEGLGLYWHFVDIVWIFLFPLLYLLGRNAG